MTTAQNESQALGVGSTVSRSRHGRGGEGYRYYRLVVLADSDVVVGAVRFWLSGSATYRNPDRIVYLYDHLLAGARRAVDSAVPAEILPNDAIVADGLAGPFRLQSTDSVSLTAVAAAILDADGREVTGPVAPGAQFLPAAAVGQGRRTSHRDNACDIEWLWRAGNYRRGPRRLEQPIDAGRAGHICPARGGLRHLPGATTRRRRLTTSARWQARTPRSCRPRLRPG